MKRTNISFEKIFIVIGIIAIIYLSYILFFKNLHKNKYQQKENEMVEKAKKYVINNNISTSKEIYLNVNKLNVTMDNNCSVISGVIYDGTSYKPYLSCDDYKSLVIDKNQKEKEYITLNGEEVLVLAKGMTFYDPGYNSRDAIEIVGNIGTEEGIYNIYYEAKNSNHFVIRKVIIIDDNSIKDLFPVINLKGNSTVYLVQGEKYNEPGYDAYDKVDGTITNKVKVDNNVNSKYIDEYIVSYEATNSRGYTRYVNRKVYVCEKESNLNISYDLTPANLTNESVTITLNISGEFDHIIYPNGSSGTNLSYTVNENGQYDFYIFDKYGRRAFQTITVNNIDKTMPQGTCIAEIYYDRTEITVTLSSTRDISSYEYVVNNNSIVSQTNKFTSNIQNPSSVKVILKDIINNKSEITCSIKDNKVRKIVTDNKGKNCLEGLTCYVQFDYSDKQNYPYCSMSNNQASCGGIGRNGCSITSTSNAIAFMGIKSKNGMLYTPYTVWEELYPINKKTGQCNGGCSAWSRMKDAITSAGLSTSKVMHINKTNMPQVTEHLKKGYPVIVYAEEGPYAQKGHYMTLIGIREDGYVFLSDSANKDGTLKAKYKGKQYYSDTWISTDDLISGNVTRYLLVGPNGMF